MMQTFKDALKSTLSGMIHRIAFPDWILNLYSTGRRTKIACEELRVSETTITIDAIFGRVAVGSLTPASHIHSHVHFSSVSLGPLDFFTVCCTWIANAPYHHFSEQIYMAEMIETRRNAAEIHQDLFSNLLKAREEEKDGSTVFSDDDLIGKHC
jgi:hypothetical protein